MPAMEKITKGLQDDFQYAVKGLKNLEYQSTDMMNGKHTASKPSDNLCVQT